MSNVSIVLLIIVCLFLLLLAIKQTTMVRNICTICMAVSTTWIALLLLSLVSTFNDQVLIAILMGQSSLGIYYVLEKHAPRQMLIFRLPLLISLIYIVYSVVTRSLYIDSLALVMILWLSFGLLYLYRVKPLMKSKVKKLIECCGGW